MTLDTKAFRQTLGYFATGISVVTTQDSQGQFVGLTVNSFSSVSLNPPLVLFSLDKRSSGLQTFQDSNCFAVNILSDKQETISSTFSSDVDNKFLDIQTYQLKTGAPLIKNCLTVLDCRTVRQYDEGDHIIFIGEVQEFQSLEGNPLLFYCGQYRLVKPQSK